MKNYLNEKVIYAIYFLFLLLVYSPVYLCDYASQDDYNELRKAAANIVTYGQWEIQCGRPLYGLLKIPSELALKSLEDLAIFRFISVIGIVLSACMIYRFLRVYRLFDENFRIVLPLFLALVPGFQIYASWFVCYPFAFALCLTCLSALLLYSKQFTWVKFFGSLVCCCLSFAIYQPLGMSFIFFASLYLFTQNRGSVRHFVLSGMVVLAGMIFSLVISKFIPKYFFENIPDRAGFPTDIIGKIDWFFNDAFIAALSNYNVNPVWQWTLFSLSFFLLGVVSFVKKQRYFTLAFVGLLVSMVVSYLPCLVTKDNWSSFRTLVCLEFFTVTFILVGIYKLFTIIFKEKKHIPFFSLIFALVLAAISVNYNIINGMVIPQITNYDKLRIVISQKVSKDYEGEVYFRYSNKNYCFSKKCRLDEFYYNSQMVDWAIEGMIDSIKREYGYKFQYRKEEEIKSGNNSSVVYVDIMDSVS